MAGQGTGTVTILFTDLVNSTELLQRAGDERAQRILRAHHELLKQTVDRHGGHPVKWLGDGLMVAFPSAAEATQCAIGIQQAGARPFEGERLRIRVGLNTGEALLEESDYFGTPVVVARRLCDRAEAGQILASAVLPALLAGRPAFHFRELGPLELKGIDAPVSACEVLYEPPTGAAIGLARMPFVGREKEMAGLRSHLAETLSGRGGVVTLAGDPGIGKTRLAEEFCEEARRRGAQVLWGRCYEGESSRPYGPFAEAIEDFTQSRDLGDVLREMGPDIGLVAGLALSLGESLSGLPEPPRLEPEEERFRLLHAAAHFFVALCAKAPLVLVLEDMHWAGGGTVAMLRHVARIAAKNALLVLATYRHVELAGRHPLSDALVELPRETKYERILLKGLPAEDVAQLLEALSEQEVPAAFAAVISSETDGNPLFIRELLLHLIEEGKVFQRDGRWTSDLAVSEMGIPEGVRQAIGRRLSRLSEGALRTLSQASVLGRNFDFDVLAAFTEMGEESLLETLEEALGAQLIEETKGQYGASYRFTHELVRQTLYGEMSIARRERLHLRAGRALEGARGGRQEAVTGEIARHFREGNDPRKAIEYSLRAGEAARAVFAYEEAIEHWEAALELMEREEAPAEERAGLLERLGHTLSTSGLDLRKGTEHAEQALELYSTLGRNEKVAEMHSRLGRYLSGFGARDIPRALEHYRAAEAVLATKPEGEALGYLYVGIASAASWAARIEEGLAASRRAIQIAERIEDEALWATAASICGWHLVVAGHIQEARLLLGRAWEVGDRLNLPAAYLAAQTGACLGFYVRDPVDYREWCERELATPRLTQAPAQRAMFVWHVGWAHVMDGDLKRAGRQIDAIREGSPGLSVSLEAMLALYSGGDIERVETDWGRPVEEEVGDRWPMLWTANWFAKLPCARGDYGRAERVLQEGLEIAVDGGAVLGEMWVRPDLALLYAETGRAPQAAVHLARCREILAEGEDWRGLAGRVALAEAAVAAAEGRVDEARPHFEHAIETFRRYTLPWDEAEALYVWGNALLKRRKRAAAREKLEAALGIYEKHGAGEPWKARVRAVLCRIEPGSGAPVYPDDLTEREVEVLRLIAAGTSNSEIAEALVLSVRTVERHITNLYGKIGAHGKVDATRYALEHGLTRPV